MSDLTPGSPEWQRKITASKVAAILGVSPWDSPRSVWHTMRGDLPGKEQTEVMSRGHYLEPAILAWFRDQHPEYADWREQHPRFLGDWAAATPDMEVWREEQCLDEAAPDALVEAKSAAYDDDWGDPGTDQIPLYYLVQCQWQMHVFGVHRCYVPIITSRLRFAEYVVDYDAESGPLLEQRMREFYDSLSADAPPPLDDSVATFQTMRRLHPEIERGESVELTEDEAWNLIDSAASLKCAEAEDRIARSTVLDRMARAQYATHNGVRIARRQPRGDAVTFVVVAKPEDLAPEGDAA